MDLRSVATIVAERVPTDVVACQEELVAIGRLRGMLDAREIDVIRRLGELADDQPTVFPHDVVARATKTSLLQADRLHDRAATCEAIPELGAALQHGSTSGDRIDIVAKAAVGLNDSERLALAVHGERLAEAASEQTAGVFRRTVEHIVRQVRVDDGLARLEQQRRMATVKWFTDADGMWCLHGRFDPATGVRIEGRIRNTIEQLFHERTPDTSPVGDPLAKQQHLAALAVMALFEGEGATSGAPDVSVVIDERTLREGHAHDGTICDVGLGRVGLPVETIRRWACTGTVTPVVVAADGSRLLLGRETRLANRAQRRALRVLYRSCALCDVPFDHCEIHHVTWFTLGGLTDVENLLPVCSKHHHLVHEGGWVLHLDADRTLTVARPGGVVTTHGPPRVWAA